MSLRIAMLIPDNRDEYRRYQDPEPYFGPAPSALLQGLALLPECEVHLVCCVQRALGPSRQIGERLFYHPLVVGKWGWLRGLYLGCTRAIRAKLRELRPDVVHGQGSERFPALAAAYSGFPNAITLHGNMRMIAAKNRARPGSFHWCAARLETVALRKAGGVVCISNYTRSLVKQLASKTWLIPNAVDSSFFDVRRVQTERDCILCVGHILPLKNQVALIRALDGLAVSRDFFLCFLGGIVPDDPYANEFLSLVHSRPWCRYEGLADRGELQRHLSAARLLVLPTLEDNCPMVILEAMAAGVAVVGTKIGGVPDLIDDGKTGRLCQAGSEAELRDAIAGLLDDRLLADALAERARALALERFQPLTVAKRHLEVYREILGIRSDEESLAPVRIAAH